MLQQDSSKTHIVLSFPAYHQNKHKSSTHFEILCYKNIPGCKDEHRTDCEWRNIRTNTAPQYIKGGGPLGHYYFWGVTVDGPLPLLFWL